MNENNYIKPLKKFGQNYLQDKNILRKIVDEISPAPDDNILEIGPGQGALTELLIEKVTKLTAIEIDFRVINGLLNKFPNLYLIQNDFLKISLKEICSSYEKKFRIVGNIPYNLTSPILFKLIEEMENVKDTVLMIQLEVAQRIIANPNTKEYGILSVLLNTFAETKIVFKVSPNVFFPKPKVHSAVIHIIFNKNIGSIKDKIVFINTVKACFGKRRKTLKNSLSSSIFADINFSDCPIDLSKRAEQLQTSEFILLANYIYNHMG